MLAAAIAFLATSAAFYEAVDMGVDFKGFAVDLVSLNDRGEVVGYKETGEVPNLWTVGVYWKDGKAREIRSPIGGDFRLVGINKHGLAAGLMGDPEKTLVPFTWSVKDGLQRIPDGANEFEPLTINNRGVIGGSLYDPETTKYFVATWSEKDGYRRLHEFDFYGGGPTGLNDRGDVLYWLMVSGNPQDLRGPFYQPSGGSEQLLSSVPDAQVEGGRLRVWASDINNQGWMCGKTDHNTRRAISDQSNVQGTLWSPDNTRFEVGRGVTFTALNDANVAVGYRRPANWPPVTEAVIYDRARGLRSLTDSVSLKTAKLTKATAINDKGEILCAGVDAIGVGHWYLLKPIK